MKHDRRLLETESRQSQARAGKRPASRGAIKVVAYVAAFALSALCWFLLARLLLWLLR